MSLGYSLFWRILCFGKLPIIPRHKSDRCRIYRKVVIVISVILSRPFGYGPLFLVERACFGLGSHSPWRWRSIVSPSKISSGSTCYKRSKDGDVAKKDEIVMKCQLNVYLPQTLCWNVRLADTKQYFRRHYT